MKKIFFFQFLLIANICYGAKPPPEILDQMAILSNIEATISTCLDSDDYKKLNAEQALKFHDVSINISKTIELIEKKYNDDMAYLVVKMNSMDISSKAEFKSVFAKTYSRKCAPQILVDTNQALDITSRKIKTITNRR